MPAFNQRIKPFIYLMIIAMGLYSCSEPKKELPISEKIIGSWKSDYFPGDWRQEIFVFTFQDTTCSFPQPFGPYSPYQIKGDTLDIKWSERNRITDSVNVEHYKFLIDSLSESNLFLNFLNTETVSYGDYFESVDPGLLKLSKITQKNDVVFERIGFYSTGCFGTCPSMYLEIDSEGNMLFDGQYHTQKKGLQSGKISQRDLELITTKIRAIQLDSLKPRYSAGWTDDQTCGVKIKTKTDTYESSAYGFHKEPVELRNLFHKLIELYKHTELKVDSSIGEQFVFKDFQR